MHTPVNQEPSPRGLERGPFIEKFCGKAGEPVERNQDHLGYVRYSRDLQSEDVPSEWAPFSSRMEWEVARWAKLRGPSSTALSELLHINGVRWLSLSSSTTSLNIVLLYSLQAHLV
jgi:hypothetical protein